MHIMVLSDGKTYSALPGCKILDVGSWDKETIEDYLRGDPTLEWTSEFAGAFRLDGFDLMIYRVREFPTNDDNLGFRGWDTTTETPDCEGPS